jgi:DNA replication and repair protein RecF
LHVAHLSLHDFRSYPAVEVEIGPGITSFVGRNGQGKTNLVEAIDYLSRLTSHRVSADAPLVRQGASQAVVRAAVVRDERRAVLEIEINPGRSNRARVNKSPLPKARELLGLLRTVVFSPEDLALVKGDPAERRRFADELLTQIAPRYAGTRADYDRVLKQRNSLLKSAGAARRSGAAESARESALSTLAVWDTRLAELGAEIMRRRIQLVADLTPLVGKAYEAVARGASRDDATIGYRPSFEMTGPEDLEAQLLAAVEERRRDELDRGLSLVGPHRDDLVLSLGDLPAKGYASHGESWSFALALRLASYDLLRATGDDPVLILDDVFAELDTGRRAQLADLVADAEQVLITAAVPDDIPAQLRGRRFTVAGGEVTADE